MNTNIYGKFCRCILWAFLFLFIIVVCVKVWKFYHPKPRLRYVDISDVNTVNRLREILSCEWQCLKFDKCVVENDFYVVARMDIDVSCADWKFFLDEIDKWEDVEDGFSDTEKWLHPALEAIRDVGCEGRNIIFSKENARESESSEYVKLLEYVAVRDGERMKLFIITNIVSQKDLTRLKFLEVNPSSMFHSGM